MFDKSFTRHPFIILGLIALALVNCERPKHQSAWARFQKISTLGFKVESNSPFVTKWTNSLRLANGLYISLDASSFSTIGKFIKYSDEPTARSLVGGDCNLLDIRFDPDFETLYLLTGGNIWTEDVKNCYILILDLNKRSTIEKILLSPEQLSKVQSPKPNSA